MPCQLPCELCEKKPPTAQVIIGNPYTEYYNSNSNSTGLSSTTGLVSSKAAGYVITTVFRQ